MNATLVGALLAAVVVGCHLYQVRKAFGRCTAYFENPTPRVFGPDGRWNPDGDVERLLRSGYGRRLLQDLDDTFDTVAYDARHNVLYYLATHPTDGRATLTWKGDLPTYILPFCGNDQMYRIYQVACERVRIEVDLLAVTFHGLAGRDPTRKWIARMPLGFPPAWPGEETPERAR